MNRHIYSIAASEDRSGLIATTFRHATDSMILILRPECARHACEPVNSPVVHHFLRSAFGTGGPSAVERCGRWLTHHTPSEARQSPQPHSVESASESRHHPQCRTIPWTDEPRALIFDDRQCAWTRWIRLRCHLRGALACRIPRCIRHSAARANPTSFLWLCHQPSSPS